MRGEGWECDHCGKMVVKQRPDFSSYTYMEDSPHIYPEDWYGLMGPLGNSILQRTDNHHFCCLVCLGDWAYVQAQQEVDNNE